MSPVAVRLYLSGRILYEMHKPRYDERPLKSGR